MSDTHTSDPKSRLRRFRDLFSDNLFLIIATCISGSGLFLVPQARNIIWPSATWNQWTPGFLAALSVIAFIYATTLLRFIWPRIQWGPCFTLAGWINGWLLSLARRLAPLSRGNAGYAISLGIGITGLIMLFKAGIDLNVPYPLFGGFVKTVGLWLFLVAVWLFAGRWLGSDRVLAGDTVPRRMHPMSYLAEAAPGVEPRSAWQACGEVLSWLAVMGVILELFWMTASYELPGASYRLYSVGALIHIAILWVVIGALADFLQQTTPLPARLLTVVCVIGIIVYGSFNNLSDEERESQVAAAESAPTQRDWLTALDQRIESTPEGPIVMVAASGGGSRAALFTSLVLQMLANRPMDDFPEARPTGETNMLDPGTEDPGTEDQETEDQETKDQETKDQETKDQGTWSDHIALISCVSGGSVASARYVWNNGNPANDRVEDLQYSASDELLELTQSQLKNWAGANENPRANSIAVRPSSTPSTTASQDRSALMNEIIMVSEKERDDRLKAVADAITNYRTAEDPASYDDNTQLVAEAFSARIADDMSMDFMAPILRGFITPLASRGEGLYHFWRYQFGWTEVDQKAEMMERNNLANGVDSGSTPRPLPLVLFNTSDVEGGRRVIIGFPNIEGGLLVGSTQTDSATEGRGAEYSPLSLSDFAEDPVPNISLTRAVRLSSNFPFGFGISTLSGSSQPRLKMKEDAPILRGQGDRDALRLLDGGIVDNTGVDSLYAVIHSLEQRAAQHPRGRESLLLDKLRSRGVVFLEIDSGAKPSGSGNGPFAVATRPLSALNNAVYTNALRTNDRQQAYIERALSDPVEARMIASIQGEPDPLETDQFKFEFTKEQLVAAATSVLQPRQFGDQPLSVVRFRFTCNHLSDTESHVMTALALGPSDKATVIAMYLTEAFRWRDELDDVLNEYRDNIGDKGLGGFSKEDVAALSGQLLRRAKFEVARAELKIGLLRESWDEASEPPTEEDKITQLNETLVRPVALLLAVREIARSGSDESAEQLAKITELVNGILASDDAGIPGLLAAKPTLHKGMDLTKLNVAEFQPEDTTGIYQKIDEAINQAESPKYQLRWQQQQQKLDERRNRAFQFEQMQRARSRARSEYFKGMRASPR